MKIGIIDYNITYIPAPINKVCISTADIHKEPVCCTKEEIEQLISISVEPYKQFYKTALDKFPKEP